MPTIACPNPTPNGDILDNCLLITPGDDAFAVPVWVRADSAGAVVVRAWNATADTTHNMVAGEVLPFRCKFVRTSAVVVHAIY